MFEWVKARVLRVMRVPREPEPPLGAPGSARVFRAGDNHYRLRLVRWFFGQAGAIVGIGFSLVFLGAFEASVETARLSAIAAAMTRPSPNPAASPDKGPSVSPTPVWSAPASGETRAERRLRRERDRERVMARVLTRMPDYVVPLIKLLEILGIAFLFFQMLVTYALVRLEFEQHWYIVTDRSLRIRTGIVRLQESTMSFANIQQVEIRQGPIQRLLGLADVCVRSAGGGGDMTHASQGHGQEGSLHLGVFQGVDHAVEIRDLMLERLRAFREAGLGDPEDAPASVKPAPASITAEAAVIQMLAEARALKAAILARP